MADSIQHEGGSEAREARFFCPFCGTKDETGAGFCEHCGELVDSPSSDRFRNKDLARCQICFSTTMVRAGYCVGCGESLNGMVLLQNDGNTPGIVEKIPVAEHIPEKSQKADHNTEPNSLWPFPDDQSRGVATDADQASNRDVGANQNEEHNDSGKADAVLPKELRGFNWGALLLGPVWGIGNGIWLTGILLILFLIPGGVRQILPLIYLPAVMFLGFKGSELAWRSKKWLNIDHYRRVQRAWMVWGLAIGVPLLLSLIQFVRSSGSLE